MSADPLFDEVAPLATAELLKFAVRISDEAALGAWCAARGLTGEQFIERFDRALTPQPAPPDEPFVPG